MFPERLLARLLACLAGLLCRADPCVHTWLDSLAGVLESLESARRRPRTGDVSEQKERNWHGTPRYGTTRHGMTLPGPAPAQHRWRTPEQTTMKRMGGAPRVRVRCRYVCRRLCVKSVISVDFYVCEISYICRLLCLSTVIRLVISVKGYV